MESTICREDYLRYAGTFTETEGVLIREFAQWLPQIIIDCHAHCNLPGHVRQVDDRAYHQMLSTFPSFSLEESREWQTLLHPGKTVRTLRFPKTFRGIDHKAANRYLLTQSPAQDNVALYGLPNDPAYTIEMLGHPRVSALKMYYSYLEPPATEIYQYFPKAVLAAAQEKGVPIILHPPKRITMCLDQILVLLKDFPSLRICIAHLGLAYRTLPELEKVFATIAKYPQINLDTALVPSAEVVQMAIQIIGANRVMYGSDQPLNLIRSVLYIHPRLGERLVTEYPYHWVDPAEHLEFKHLAVNTTHAHWQTLRALKTAISHLPEEKQELTKKKIFHDNAKHFFGF